MCYTVRVNELSLNMKVVLMKDVAKLGFKGDVVNVSDGYARNLLFSQNLAVQATPDALNKVESEKKTQTSREEKVMKQAGGLAKQLDDYELILTEKASEEGTLYAAVGALQIAKALKKAGHEVDPESIALPEPIKEVGESELTINLPHGFEAKIKVIIETKE